MKAEVIALDAVRVGRGEAVANRPAPAGRYSAAAATLALSACLLSIACGVVAAVLWFVWLLAEVIP